MLLSNTDERPILEFSLPKLLYMDPKMSEPLLLEILANAKDVVPPINIPEGWSDYDRERFYLGLAERYNRSNFRLDQALKVYKMVLEMNPYNKGVKEEIEKLTKELEGKRAPLQ